MSNRTIRTLLMIQIASEDKISMIFHIMEHLEIFVKQLIELAPAARTHEQIILAKRAFCKTYKYADMPTNVSVLKTYKHLLAQGVIERA